MNVNNQTEKTIIKMEIAKGFIVYSACAVDEKSAIHKACIWMEIGMQLNWAITFSHSKL